LSSDSNGCRQSLLASDILFLGSAGIEGDSLVCVVQKEYQMTSCRCSRKSITALAALQENKLLLVALDNGQILLMA